MSRTERLVKLIAALLTTERPLTADEIHARVEGPRPPVAALPGTEQLAPLFGAIAARRPVTFRYRGEERGVDPHRLSFRNGHWYLAGFDHARGEARSYRLDRFESTVVAGDP